MTRAAALAVLVLATGCGNRLPVVEVRAEVHAMPATCDPAGTGDFELEDRYDWCEAGCTDCVNDAEPIGYCGGGTVFVRDEGLALRTRLEREEFDGLLWLRYDGGDPMPGYHFFLNDDVSAGQPIGADGAAVQAAYDASLVLYDVDLDGEVTLRDDERLLAGADGDRFRFVYTDGALWVEESHQVASLGEQRVDFENVPMCCGSAAGAGGAWSAWLALGLVVAGRRRGGKRTVGRG